MEKNINLSVILPIKSAVVHNFEDYFSRAIQSLKLQSVGFTELVIVATQEEKLQNLLETNDFGDNVVKKLVWDKEPNYSDQINYGAQNAAGEWISFFEFDDEYSKIWFKNFNKYSSVYSDVDAFLPIVVDVDDKSVFAGFTNEATFAANFSAEMGILTNETLQDYHP